MWITRKKFDKLVEEKITAAIQSCIIALEENKYYILVVPSDLPVKDLRRAFENLPEKVNVTVLQADGVRLIEVSGGSR